MEPAVSWKVEVRRMADTEGQHFGVGDAAVEIWQYSSEKPK